MRIHLRFFITAVALGIIFIGITGISYGQNSISEISTQIFKMRPKADCNEAEMQEFKMNILGLLDEYESPDVKSFIYYMLVRDCWSQYDRKKRGTEKEYLEYCNGALDCPDRPCNMWYKCYIYDVMSDILSNRDSHTGQDTIDPIGRKSVVVPKLKAYRMLLDNGIPDKKSLLKPVPYDEIWNEVFKGFSRSDYDRFIFASRDGFDPDEYTRLQEANRIYEKRVGDYQDELSHKEYLVSLKLQIRYNIEYYYTQKPYNTEELQKLATDILKDKAVVSDIIAKVKKHIANGTTPQLDWD
ncbi:MAG: hypothetical protein ABFD64_02380 [Armatimonadota bacterium]